MDQANVDSARSLAERCREDQRADERREARGLELAAKLPKLESVMKYESHRRLWFTRTLQTLRELRERPGSRAGPTDVAGRELPAVEDG